MSHLEPEDDAALEPEEPVLEHEDEERMLADRLRSRPVPAPGFRGALARHLAARDSGYGPRPERLRLIVAGYLLLGWLLIVGGALAGGAL